MITYVLTLSKKFPQTHPKKGEETFFFENLLKSKKHTIRGNFELWEKRFKKIESGDACLCIRYWSGKPYKDPQVKVMQLTIDEGISLQKLTQDQFGFYVDGLRVSILDLATNDALKLQDFVDWFKKYPKKPMAVIHFTKFNYK